MNIEQKLVASVMSGLKALYGQDVPAAQIQLQKTKKEFEGCFVIGCCGFLKTSITSPLSTTRPSSITATRWQI